MTVTRLSLPLRNRGQYFNINYSLLTILTLNSYLRSNQFFSFPEDSNWSSTSCTFLYQTAALLCHCCSPQHLQQFCKQRSKSNSPSWNSHRTNNIIITASSFHCCRLKSRLDFSVVTWKCARTCQCIFTIPSWRFLLLQHFAPLGCLRIVTGICLLLTATMANLVNIPWMLLHTTLFPGWRNPCRTRSTFPDFITAVKFSSISLSLYFYPQGFTDGISDINIDSDNRVTLPSLSIAAFKRRMIRCRSNDDFCFLYSRSNTHDPVLFLLHYLIRTLKLKADKHDEASL